jgi:hypothetical protein
MLRIAVTECASEQRWALQGRLVKDTVDELISHWRGSRDSTPDRLRVVYLDEVTTIDREGEQVLLMMMADGAHFIANGLYTRHLLETMRVHHPDAR